jgi:hypothetical protein
MTEGRKPSTAEAMSWLGAEVAELGGGSVGQVQGLFVDATSGEPAWPAAVAPASSRFPLPTAPAPLSAFGSPKRRRRSAAPPSSIRPGLCAVNTS